MATIAEEGEKARVRLADPISIYFESAGVGKTMKGSKLRLSWHLCFGPYGREHIVDVTVSTRSGKREVRTRVPSPPRIWERTAPECVAMARHPRVAEEKARPGATPAWHLCIGVACNGNRALVRNRCGSCRSEHRGHLLVSSASYYTSTET